MSCEKIRDIMPEYLVDELGTDMKRVLVDHLNRCASCSSRLDRMRSIAQEIAARTLEPSSDPYFSRFLDTVNASIERLSLRRAKKGRNLTRPAWVCASAAAAVAAAHNQVLLSPEARAPRHGNTSPILSTVGNLDDRGLLDEGFAGSLDAIELNGAADYIEALYQPYPWETNLELSDEEWEEVLFELVRDNAGY